MVIDPRTPLFWVTMAHDVHAISITRKLPRLHHKLPVICLSSLELHHHGEALLVNILQHVK